MLPLVHLKYEQADQPSAGPIETNPQPSDRLTELARPSMPAAQSASLELKRTCDQLSPSGAMRESAKRVHGYTLSLADIRSCLAQKEEERFIQCALVNRKVVLRPPRLNELDHILSNLYSGVLGEGNNLNEAEFAQLIGEGGCLAKDSHSHRLVVMEQVGQEEAIGAVHYHIKEMAGKVRKCVIHSLDIHSHFSCKGYGSLLLSFAIVHAQRKQCQEVLLKTSEEGVFLYAAFGFKPAYHENIPPAAWNALPYPLKVKALDVYRQEIEPNLILDLQEPSAQPEIQVRLEKALAPESEKEGGRPLKQSIKLEEIDIPDEFYEWEILV